LYAHNPHPLASAAATDIAAAAAAAAASSLQDQLVHVEHRPGRAAVTGTPTTPLSPAVQAALAARGVQQLYSHQVEALDHLLVQRRHLVICTATASGKSLCYNVPVMETLARDPGACALYMFPTKALTQDQLRALRGLLGAAFGDAAPPVEVRGCG
jgi:DEAD/DEAH box helicase domain-containing protein